MSFEFFRATENEFQKIFEITDKSFPDEEMRPYEKAKDLFFNNKNYVIHGIKDESGEVLAFINVWELGDFIFFENFAVEPKARNKGVGGLLLEEVLKTYQKDAILEVEPPETEITQRRVEFYKRHGFIYNDFHYLMPPLREGDDFLPLKIMSYKKAFTEESFKKYKEKIYKIVYEQK